MKDIITTREDLAGGISEFLKFIRSVHEDNPPLTPEEQARFIHSVLYTGKRLYNNKPFIEGEMLRALTEYNTFTRANDMLDISGLGVAVVQVAKTQSPTGKPVLYVHVDGKTRLRISDFKELDSSKICPCGLDAVKAAVTESRARMNRKTPAERKKLEKAARKRIRSGRS